MLSLTVTSELKQRFVPLLKLYGKLLYCNNNYIIYIRVYLAADLLQAVQNYPKRVQEPMKLFVISLHNWSEKFL